MHKGITAAGSNITGAGSTLMLLDKVDAAAEVLKICSKSLVLLEYMIKIYSSLDPQVMESLTPVVVAAAKLPIINPNKFDLWKMRIEQYFLMTGYSLWKVILNGDSPLPTRIVDDAVQIVAPTTAEQMLAKKNELKAEELC
nr:hypothetical protein [Tanacetum cinerariifolium]